VGPPLAGRRDLAGSSNLTSATAGARQILSSIGSARAPVEGSQPPDRRIRQPTDMRRSPGTARPPPAAVSPPDVDQRRNPIGAGNLGACAVPTRCRSSSEQKRTLPVSAPTTKIYPFAVTSACPLAARRGATHLLRRWQAVGGTALTRRPHGVVAGARYRTARPVARRRDDEEVNVMQMSAGSNAVVSWGGLAVR
jgi:hypothetical protein